MDWYINLFLTFDDWNSMKIRNKCYDQNCKKSASELMGNDIVLKLHCDRIKSMFSYLSIKWHNRSSLNNGAMLETIDLDDLVYADRAVKPLPRHAEPYLRYRHWG